MKFVIASSGAPKAENWVQFCKDVVEEIPGILGLTLQEGYGCWNYGVIGEEKDIRRLTMALMPARYSYVGESDAGVEIGKFIDRR